MNKILLKIDESAQSEHVNKTNEKLQVLNYAIKEYRKQFSEIMDLQLFEKSFYAYAIAEIRKLQPGAKVLNLSDVKIAEMYHYDLNHLKALENKYKTLETPLKWNKYTFDVMPLDFGIYATTDDEITRYNASKNLIDALNSVRDLCENNFNINAENIYRFIDSDGIKFTPSTHFVKG